MINILYNEIPIFIVEKQLHFTVNTFYSFYTFRFPRGIIND
jgi:hypothetical protein